MPFARIRFGFALAGAAIAALSGCADPYYGDGDWGGYDGGRGERVVYRCDEGRDFAVHFLPNGREAVVDTGRRSANVRYVDREGDRRIYEGRRGRRDLQLVVRDDLRRAYLRIEDREDFRDCRAVG